MKTPAMKVKRYPEHGKLRKVRNEYRVCIELFDWLQSEGWTVTSSRHGHFSIQASLAKFFHIDEAKLERERIKVLETFHSKQVGGTE